MRDDGAPLSAHVAAPRVDEARLARQWSRVSARLSIRPRRRLVSFVILPAAAVAAAAVVVLAVLLGRSTTAPRPVATASSTGNETLALPDGSRVALAPGSALAIESATVERVRLVLASGTIDLDVTHVEGRSFVVRAAGHDVTVLGTRFRVSVDAERLLVSVERGRVGVAGRGGAHVLEAGQSWSSRLTETDGAAASSARIPTATATAAAATASPAAPATAALSIELPDTPAPVTVPAPGAESPKELLSRATEARAAGRTREAAAALDALRKRHRSDARAGLAAFELGRLRLDSLGDPAGAAEAFGDAMTLAPAAPFREDAEARRVEALDAAGDARCAQAKAAYLARYPNALHAKQVEPRCARR